MNYTYTFNKTMMPPMIGIRGDNLFLDMLFADIFDIKGIINVFSFKIGPVDHFNIYIDPVARSEDVLQEVLQIVDDACLTEYLLRDVNLDGESKAKQQKDR